MYSIQNEEDSKNDMAYLRIIEALLFAAEEPLDIPTILAQLPATISIIDLMKKLEQFYQSRGINLVKIGNKYAFRTASDLHVILKKDVTTKRRLSQAGIETLAIIAYHQPVTRAEIEEIRGVRVSKGTIDVLLEMKWVKMRGRRRIIGRPLIYGTSESFLSHFGLENLADLPDVEELKSIGLLDSHLPTDFMMPRPHTDNDEKEEVLTDV